MYIVCNVTVGNKSNIISNTNFKFSELARTQDYRQALEYGLQINSKFRHVIFVLEKSVFDKVNKDSNMNDYEEFELQKLIKQYNNR